MWLGAGGGFLRRVGVKEGSPTLRRRTLKVWFLKISIFKVFLCSLKVLTSLERHTLISSQAGHIYIKKTTGGTFIKKTTRLISRKRKAGLIISRKPQAGLLQENHRRDLYQKKYLISRKLMLDRAYFKQKIVGFVSGKLRPYINQKQEHTYSCINISDESDVYYIQKKIDVPTSWYTRIIQFLVWPSLCRNSGDHRSCLLSFSIKPKPWN